jgi:hypothetical protein
MNARRRKNFIHAIASDDGIATPHEEKEALIFDHFSTVLGTSEQWSRTLNWASLDLQTVPAGVLDNPFTAREIWEAIKDSPVEKGAGAGRLQRHLLSRVLERHQARDCGVLPACIPPCRGRFWGTQQSFCLPAAKKEGAACITDYRPKSLIHSIAKLFAKVLARHLTPVINSLISPAQSAFLKTRSLHDNFLLVRNIARSLHRKKKPSLMIKIDFARAFDSVPGPIS